MGFKIKSCEKQNIGIISIEGEVDMFTSPNFRDEMLPYFQKGVKTIIVDLKGVSFMDSSGIATLVEGLQWSKKEQGRQFILTGPGPNVKNALALTKLDNIFTIKDNKDEVLRQLTRTR
jgi:anti-sigma B factor antagonist